MFINAKTFHYYTRLKTRPTVYLTHNQPENRILTGVPTTVTAALLNTRTVVIGEAFLDTDSRAHGTWTQSGISSTGIWYKTHRQQH